MGCKILKINLVSADNLPDIRWLGRMKVYAGVSLNGEPKTSIRTTVDMDGKTNPRWDLHQNYTINKASLRKPGLEVVVKLYCERTWGDKYIGEVKIPIKELYVSRLKGKKERSFDVAGTKNGKLNISYSFGKMLTEQEPQCWKKALKAGLKVGFVVMTQAL